MLFKIVKSFRKKFIFILGYVCGVIKVSYSIFWVRNIIIFFKFRLICFCRVTNISVSGGVVEMFRGILNCGGRGRWKE